MRGDGYSWAAIRDTLNNAGVPSPSGAYWTHGTLTSIVKNETYTGVVILGERRAERAHTPVVSKAQFKAAQSTRTITRNGRNVQGIAGGLLVCSGCGMGLSVLRSDKGGRLSYGCRRQSSAGHCPRPVYVSKPRADAFVERVVEDELGGDRLALVASARDVESARLRIEEAREEFAAFTTKARASDPATKAVATSASVSYARRRLPMTS